MLNILRFSRINLYETLRKRCEEGRYPVMGYIFADFLKRCADKKIFYKYLFAFSSLTVIAVSLGAVKYDFDLWSMHFGPLTYYYQDFLQYILVGGIVFTWLSVMYALSSLKPLGYVGNHLSRWSKNTTVIYFAQWLIIGWFSILGLIDLPVSPIVNLTTGIVVFMISDAAAVFYIKIQQGRS
jgi:hypothetical protein